jgi:hypothetical protein
VAKPDGVVLVVVAENEGEREGYKGLHQWNIAHENGALWLWRRGLRLNLGRPLERVAGVSITRAKRWLEITAVRNGRPVDSFPDDLAAAARQEAAVTRN